MVSCVTASLLISHAGQKPGAKHIPKKGLKAIHQYTYLLSDLQGSLQSESFKVIEGKKCGEKIVVYFENILSVRFKRFFSLTIFVPSVTLQDQKHGPFIPQFTEDNEGNQRENNTRHWK